MFPDDVGKAEARRRASQRGRATTSAATRRGDATARGGKGPTAEGHAAPA